MHFWSLGLSGFGWLKICQLINLHRDESNIHHLVPGSLLEKKKNMKQMYSEVSFQETVRGILVYKKKFIPTLNMISFHSVLTLLIILFCLIVQYSTWISVILLHEIKNQKGQQVYPVVLLCLFCWSRYVFYKIQYFSNIA